MAASPAQGINCPRRCTQVPWSYCYGLASRLVGTAGYPWEAGISIAQLAVVPSSSDPLRVRRQVQPLDSSLEERSVHGAVRKYRSYQQPR